jgi:hypothetical protein
MLQAKQANIGRMRSTIHPEANVQPASAKQWQIDSPGGANQPAYPLYDAAPVILASFQVPAGMSGALTGLVIIHNGLAGSFVDNSGDAVWHLTKNGASVPGYENILSQVGSTQNPQGLYLLLQQNDTLQIWVAGPQTDVPAPVGNPFARMIGWLNYGGQGTYFNPREGNGENQRGAGANRYAPGTNNGSQPNTFGGSNFNRQW